MKTVINKPNYHAKYRLDKRWQGVMILFSVSVLLGCSPPENNALNASSIQTQQQAVTTKSSKTDSDAMSSPAAHPDLLKSISATVYKDANCGCCKDWISHTNDNGLNTTVQDVADVALFKDRYDVPNELRSCHTAVTTAGYVFEGHVPAKYMAQFLANPPAQAIGLAVPAMPMGSPGMEYKNQFDPYQIMQINKDGSTQVYADITSAEQQSSY